MHCLVVEEPRRLSCSFSVSSCTLGRHKALFWERSHFCSVWFRVLQCPHLPVLCRAQSHGLRYVRSSAAAACVSPRLQFAASRGCSPCPCHASCTAPMGCVLCFRFFTSVFSLCVSGRSGGTQRREQRDATSADQQADDHKSWRRSRALGCCPGGYL